MDVIKKCFKINDSAFSAALVAVGFSEDQIIRFLPETQCCILHTIKNHSLEKIIGIMLSRDPARILYLIDIDTMAEILGMSSSKVRSGFDAITPVMSRAMSYKTSEIVAATASSAWSIADERALRQRCY